MKTRLLVVLSLAACMFIGLFPVTTFAQITPDVAEGLTPYQFLQGGDIDSVNLSNGNVLIRIPLWGYPQRGNSLKWGTTYVDNTKVAATGQICAGTSGCYYEWGASPPNKVPVVFNALVDDQSVYYVRTLYTLPNNGQFAVYAVVSSDGAVHPIDVNPTATNYETMDATGFTANPSGTDWLTAPTLIVDRSGNRYSSLREDTNGNELFTPALPTGDTVGRLFPNGTATTDYSGCAGPLPTTSAYNLSLPGPNNGSVTYKFCDASLTVNIPSTETPGVRAYTSTNPITQCIVLPNGTTWIFAYNDRNPGDPSSVNFGIPTTITMPTGGTINYTFTTIQYRPAGTSSWSRWVATRTVNANDGTGPHTWTYAYANVAQTTSTTTVTDPLGNNTIHTFAQVDGYRETQTQIYQLINGVQTLLKTVVTAYKLLNGGSPYYPCVTAQPQSVTTIWPNNQETQVQTDYDSQGTGGFWSYGNLIAEREYAYGTGAPGALLRTTTINYLALSNSSYLANNLLDLKSSVQITDGGGTQRAYTTYGYDAYSLAPSGITTQHDANPPAGTYRGNLTSVAKWLNTTGGYLTSTMHYFDTGEVQIATDPKSNNTTYAYSSAYAGSLPTTVINALNQTSTYGYDFNIGKLTSAEDPNNQTSSYTYDNMFRLATATYPDGGAASITHQETTFPFSATLTKSITSSLNYVTTNIFDGVGRVSQSELTSDAPSTTYTVTQYDALGRKSTVYNPTRCNPPTTNCGESTWGYVAYAYDGLSRITQVTQPDGSTLQTSYTGSSTTVTDEAGKKRTTVTDGLGRLINVFEDPSGLNYESVYQYDALDDLTNVAQNSSRQRTFAYDSLKRLTSANNPESGTVAYTYDADGNVLTRLDARSKTTTYAYDALNRVLSKTYTDSTPTVTYAYDGNSPVGCSTGVSSYGLAIGRRTAMCDAGSLGIESWVYNDTQNVGWQIIDRRTTGSVTESITTQNNLAGSLTTLTYPSGRIITYTDNGAERPISAQDVANGITYGSSGTYAPPGELSSISQGSSVKVTNIYNSRLQPCWIYATNGTALPGSTLCTGSATTGNIIDLKYNFAFGTADNGNVASITNDRAPNRGQSFTYDSLNRITSGATTATHATDPTDCWGEAYVYDVPASTGAWGNLIQINPVSSAYTGCTQEGLNQTVTQYNQISGWCYDLSGNLQMESASPCPSPTYSYNAENQLTSTTAGVSYTYDGDGKRVSKSNGKLYWYGGGSAPIAETDASGNTTDEYIFFRGQRIARRDSSGNIIYYAADHLGTSRIVTNVSGTILDESDFYPFGGERVITASSGNTYKFTGKERDSESNLDNFGARYDSSSLGRFMSPDPKILSIRHLVNPQKWNKYAYTINNPLRYFDPDGMEEIEVQLRAVIQVQTRSDFKGKTFAGDNRGFTSAQNVTSRTSITVRIETDASKRPGNPIISVTQPGTAGQTRQVDANGNVINSATATTGLPTVSGSRDANGNAVLNFQQNTVNPLEPQSLTPGISASLTTTITQNGLSVDTTGTVSGSPSFELNVGSTNIPLQSEPSSDLGFALGLFGSNTIQNSTPLPPPPPPPPPCAADKEQPCQ